MLGDARIDWESETCSSVPARGRQPIHLLTSEGYGKLLKKSTFFNLSFTKIENNLEENRVVFFQFLLSFRPFWTCKLSAMILRFEQLTGDDI